MTYPLRIPLAFVAKSPPAAFASPEMANTQPPLRATTVSASHTPEYSGVFAGLRPAPARHERCPPRAIRACALPSPANPDHHIDAMRVDLATAIARVDLESSPSQPHEDRAMRNWQRRAVLECMRTCAGEAYTTDLATVPDIGKLRFDAQMSTPR